MEFKDKVKFVRERLHLSQVDLAKELGVAFTTVNYWERGLRQPTYIMQRKFYSYCEMKKIEIEL